MRNISFAITTDQFRARTKTVTRRLGWKDLKPGERLQGVEKSQGLKKGEKVVPLGVIVVKAVDLERLDALTTDPEYGLDECTLEGFPEMTPPQFVRMFCAANGCKPDVEVTRIEFEYVDLSASGRTTTTAINPALASPFPTGRMP